MHTSICNPCLAHIFFPPDASAGMHPSAISRVLSFSLGAYYIMHTYSLRCLIYLSPDASLSMHTSLHYLFIWYVCSPLWMHALACIPPSGSASYYLVRALPCLRMHTKTCIPLSSVVSLTYPSSKCILKLPLLCLIRCVSL
jgi:hypothetical protein